MSETRSRRWPLRLAQVSPLIALALIAVIMASVPRFLWAVGLDVLSHPVTAVSSSQLRRMAGQTDMIRVGDAADLWNSTPTSLDTALQASWMITSGRQGAYVTTRSVSPLPFSFDATPYAAIRTWEKAHDATVWAWVVQPAALPKLVASATADPAALQQAEAQAKSATSDLGTSTGNLFTDYLISDQNAFVGAVPPLDPNGYEVGGGSGGGSDTLWMMHTAMTHDGRVYRAVVSAAGDSYLGDNLQVPGVVTAADPTAPGFQRLVQRAAKAGRMNLWIFGPLNSTVTPLRAPDGVTTQTAAVLGQHVWPSFDAQNPSSMNMALGPLPPDVAAVTGGVYGALSVGSLWTTSLYGDVERTATEIAPQSVAYLAVFKSIPGGSPTPIHRAWSTWSSTVSAYLPWLIGAMFALLGVTFVLSPMAFVHERRLRARERVRAEMERMQRDAHDKVYNRLSALSKRVATAGGKAQADLATALTAIAEDIRGTVGELQEILGEEGVSADTSLTTLPIAKQIAAVCRAQAARLSMEVDFMPEAGLPTLPPATGWDLQCIAEEALTNAARHGHAHTAYVTLSAEDAGVVLRVADDGAGVAGGISIDGLPGESTGLRGAQERVRNLGGTLEIDSSPDGTTLTASVPTQPAT